MRRAASTIGGGLAMISLMVTVGAVGAAWSRRWWPAVPAVLVVAALVRLHMLPSYG
jgi:hypothetical protein